MTDKQLRRLKRSDLIEILYYLSRENDELKEKNAMLEKRIDSLIEKIKLPPDEDFQPDKQEIAGE